MKKSILFILFLFYFSTSVFGQISVKGKVVDENGEPLFWGYVKVKESNIKTVVDIDGNFELVVTDKNITLIFEAIGYISKEIKASEIPKEITLAPSELVECYIGNYSYTPLVINYWSGVFYTPYGISLSKSWHYVPVIDYLHINLGYSTNFQKNSDFYGRVGTEILKRNIYYNFQQTTFNQSETENRITTHLLESNSYLRFIKTKLLYGIGYQKFSKKALESSEIKNYGVHLGLSKYVKYVGTISAKSFYWQDYWAWEANLNKSIYYRKLRLNTAISYRQTTQDFKEVNLSLGYIF